MLLAGQSGEEATFARTSPSGSLFKVLFDKQNSAMMVIGDSDDEGCDEVMMVTIMVLMVVVIDLASTSA